MDKYELLVMLKKNLSLKVYHKQETEYENGEIRVTIFFDGIPLCEDFDYVYNR